VKDNVLASEFLSPAKDGVNHSIHLFNLYVAVTVTMGSTCGKPARSKDSSDALGSAGVGVYMNSFPMWRDEMDAVPRGCEVTPPFKVTAGEGWYLSSSVG